MENSTEILYKAENRATIWSCNSTLGHISGETIVQKDTCTPMFTEAQWNTIYNEIQYTAVLCWSSHEDILHVQGKRNPSKMAGAERGHQRTDRMKPQSQTTSQSDTWTIALSSLMKLNHAMQGHPRWMGHGGEFWQNVVHWRRQWQMTSVFLPWEPHKKYEKAKK